MGYYASQFSTDKQSKATGQVATLHEVDKLLRQHLGCEVHPENWVMGWYDSIGFLIATKTERFLGSEELRTKVSEWFGPEYDHSKSAAELNKILKFLEENYTSDSWYSYK